jgi:DNA-binding NarL/FixJ family response regulator
MRVLLVDEQRLFREGLRALLGPSENVQIVGEAANAREAYGLVSHLKPDLIMMELVLPGVDGVAAAREIRRLHPPCKILVLTGCRDRRLLQAAWLSGIDGCLTKDESVDTLRTAIGILEIGRRYIGASMRKTHSQLRIVTEEVPSVEDPLAQLSTRERVVFNLVVRGFSTKAVAQELSISAKTVETHRAHINEKLSAHCTADLVRYAFRNKVDAIALASSKIGGGSRPRLPRTPVQQCRPMAKP